MTRPPVLFEKRDRVAYLTFDRPDALNALDEATLKELAQRFAEVADDQEVKALVLTGSGETFCVGLDIELLGRAFSDSDYFRDVLGRFNRLLGALEKIPVPVIAAVNGLARAGGFEIMLACDLVLIAEEARVADNHLAFGVVPGGGATQRAPRKLGPQRARELIFTGRWVKGIETVQIGLALRTMPRVGLEGAVEELVDQLRPLSRACLAATKRAMIRGEDLPLEEALQVEIEEFMRYLEEVPSSREGYLAFVERRKPSWP